ncbi:MAG: shikimate kinase [Clostridia bacterium]|nr:shikimate kinase [Clostridia bacterium]
MNLILCGMMGVGKTTVGIKIEEKDCWRWIDTDALIVEKYGEISQIFAQYGEKYFRDLETELVKSLANEDGLVISVGGGLVLKEENCALLKGNGKIVFLRAALSTLVQRLRLDTARPLLQTGQSTQERIAELLEVRTPIYERVADWVVDVDGKTPDEIATEILSLVKKEKGGEEK